jgi:valyl-tRNA synthetase
VAAERERLAKALSRARNDLARAEAKLANRQFVDHAPAQVVDKERGRLRTLQQEIAQLDEQAAKLAKLS